MKGSCLVKNGFCIIQKGKIIPKVFIILIFMILSTGMPLAECSNEHREKAVKAGIDPKVVKILCGDSLEEDYVFEVKPMKTREEIFKKHKHHDDESQDHQMNSLDLSLDFPEGPPSCGDEKVGRMIVQGLSDHLIRSICGEGVILEKSDKDLKRMLQGKACYDSNLHNPLRDEICLKR